MRANRPKHRDLKPEAKRRAVCRAYTNVLVRRGQLTKGPCQNCGAAKAQAHHTDYSDPRTVTWLCGPCHRAEHRKL